MPLDDENTSTYIIVHGKTPYDRAHHRAMSGIGDPKLYSEHDFKWRATWENRFGQQRSTMKERWGGLGGFEQEDAAVALSMGPIFDRTREHLVPADAAIVHMRRLLLTVARDLAAGTELPRLPSLAHIKGVADTDRRVLYAMPPAWVRDAGKLEAGTDFAADGIADGKGEVAAKIQAHVILAVVCMRGHVLDFQGNHIAAAELAIDCEKQLDRKYYSFRNFPQNISLRCAAARLEDERSVVGCTLPLSVPGGCDEPTGHYSWTDCRNVSGNGRFDLFGRGKSECRVRIDGFSLVTLHAGLDSGR